MFTLVGSSYPVQVPEEIIDAISALNTKHGLKVMEYLINTPKLYHNEIKKQFSSSRQKEVEQDLTSLSKAALIDQYTTSLDNTSEEKSFYTLSPFAVNLINGMISSLEPTVIKHKIINYEEPIVLERQKRDEKSMVIAKKTIKINSGYAYNEKSLFLEGVFNKIEDKVRQPIKVRIGKKL
jgi:hypothetical protein